MKTEKILLAGATGYLGQYILAELLKKEYPTRIVVRNKAKIAPARTHTSATGSGRSRSNPTPNLTRRVQRGEQSDFNRRDYPTKGRTYLRTSGLWSQQKPPR